MKCSTTLSILLIGTLLILATVIPSPTAQAGYADQPPPLPGWTHPVSYGSGVDTTARHGINLGNAPIIRSSPVIAEIDGNAANHKEVAVVTSDGFLHVRRANGTQLWSPVQLLPAPCSPASDDYVGNSNPVVGTLLGDGVPYIVVGYGTILPSNCDGGIVAVNGQTGQIAWRFSLRQWQQQQGYPAEDLYGVVASIALADTDSDGKLEIAFGGLDRNLYLLSAVTSSSYTVRWYYHAADTIWSTPIFYNIDADPELELLAATDITANPVLVPPTQDGGFLHAFDTAPRNPKRIEFQTGFIWRTYVDQSLYSSPAIGDVLASNPGSELVIGASCFFPVSNNPVAKQGRWVKIFRLSDGQVLQTLNAPECVESSPALGDIDGDGKLEIVVNVGWAGDNGIPHSETIAWDPENPTPKWRAIPYSANYDDTNPNKRFNDPNGGHLQSPVIADINGDGIVEVLTANFWSVVILRGYDGQQMTCYLSPACGSQPSLYAWYTVKATPAVGDVNSDGILDVVIGGGHQFASPITAHLYAWTNLALVLPPQIAPSGYQTAPAYNAPWPQFRRSATNDGVLNVPGLQAAITELFVLTDGSVPETYEIALSSRDGSELSLSLSESGDSQNIISATLSSPKLSNVTPSNVVITVNAASVANGVYPVTLTVSAPSLPTVTINVTVRKVTVVYRTQIPYVAR
ncbi:MAG: pyrrolo-quinoline quinone [Chloroflexus sp.]|uniref:FG-GAP repeat domain-containing protein n=1 Tax=Chloroflexus sp. TaxID=1904827 RepID=UPI0021DC5068|nr:FG-GAP-like repeat-containing protein [Chloroflexus sp.]GIV88046.1 MAG: pyrrolo-quinoline quinone [Chloroflexus sp.]